MFNDVYTHVYIHVFMNVYACLHTYLHTCLHTCLQKEKLIQRLPPSQPSAHICACFVDGTPIILLHISSTGRPKKKGDMEIRTVSFLIQLYFNLGSKSLPV